MKISYSKTCKLPEDLIFLLKSRGLSIPDEQGAISYLANIGYFRLSAYMYPLLKDPKEDHLYKTVLLSPFSLSLSLLSPEAHLSVPPPLGGGLGWGC
jgi:hypothetical protein